MPRILITDEKPPQSHSCLEMVGCLVIGMLAVIGLGTVLVISVAILANA